VEVRGLATIVLGGDTARLREWLGEHDLPVRFSGGPAGVESISIATDSGTIEIPWGLFPGCPGAPLPLVVLVANHATRGLAHISACAAPQGDLALATFVKQEMSAS
jgi:hypothetical protein